MKTNCVNLNMGNIYAFFKGRVAFYAILKAIGVRAGDEVILPGFTCVVIPNAIIYHCAKPVYVDINSETFNIDPQLIEEKITEKTKAIIAQHTFGIPADMNKILHIAKKHNLFVIEDSCHALGSKYKGKEVGSFGDAAFFSSQWSKPVTTGLGGWAVINNQALRERMERIYHELSLPSNKDVLILKLQYHLYSKFFKPNLFWFARNAYRLFAKAGLAIGSSSNDELESRMPQAYQKKMSLWQENLLNLKLANINDIIEHRQWITSIYNKSLLEKGIVSIKSSEDYDPVFLRYPVMVHDKRKVLDEARRKRIELGDWFLSPVHPNLERWERVSYQKGMCPNAEKTCKHIINLPTHKRIAEEDAFKIADFISKYLKA